MNDLTKPLSADDSELLEIISNAITLYEERTGNVVGAEISILRTGQEDEFLWDGGMLRPIRREV